MATVLGGRIYFAGAPRHKHTGAVFGFTRDTHTQHWGVTHTAHGIQVLCVCVCAAVYVRLQQFPFGVQLEVTLSVSLFLVSVAGVVFRSGTVRGVWY